jgi:tight adherence protein B
MTVIMIAVFAAVFLVAALVMAAAGAGTLEQQKQTLNRLDSVLIGARTSGDEVLDVRREEVLSTIPWLNRWLQRIDLFPKLRLLLYQADLKWTVGGLLLMCAFVWVIAANAIYWRTGAVAFSILLGCIPGAGPLGYVLAKRSARFDRFEERLPDALDMMVSALRAGHSFTSAMGTAAREASQPVAGELKTCVDEQNFGLELRAAMANLATRVPIDDVRMIVTAVLIQKESGGNLAEILEKVASIIRDRFRLKRQIRVYTAQGRLTGWILAILPVVLGVGLYMVNPANMSLLWKRPVGVKLLWTACIMTTIGALIIRKIIRVRI